MINASNIARDCGVNRSTVQEYFQILVDTMIGYHIYPYHEKVKRDIVTAMPKFYFFDVAIANFLARQKVTALKGTAAGKSFENYIAMELFAQRGLQRKRHEIRYWRTKSGLEVDFILGNAEVAIEVKISTQVHQQDLKGLIAFCEEHPQARAIVVSQDMNERLIKINDKLDITILPWQTFVSQLWDAKVI
jgi:predicted AAA+ superfamily ATPase